MIKIVFKINCCSNLPLLVSGPVMLMVVTDTWTPSTFTASPSLAIAVSIEPSHITTELSTITIDFSPHYTSTNLTFVYKNIQKYRPKILKNYFVFST